LQPINVDNVDNFFPHYPHAKTLDFKGFFKLQKKLSTFFLKLSTKKGRVIHIFFEILCKPKNVDNFVDNFFKEWKNCKSENVDNFFAMRINVENLKSAK